MKATTRRLLILDTLIVVVCLLQMNIGIHPRLLVPSILSDIILLVYGLWLLAQMWKKDNLQP